MGDIKKSLSTTATVQFKSQTHNHGRRHLLLGRLQDLHPLLRLHLHQKDERRYKGKAGYPRRGWTDGLVVHPLLWRMCDYAARQRDGRRSAEHGRVHGPRLKIKKKRILRNFKFVAVAFL